MLNDGIHFETEWDERMVITLDGFTVPATGREHLTVSVVHR